MSTVTIEMTTRDKIIELGRDYVQRLGYHSFKYQLIAKDLDIKNAAIHHYFPTKEDLGAAIIDKDHADFVAMTKPKKDSAREQLETTLLETYLYFLKGKKNLCVIGACISAYTELPEKMKKAVQSYIHTLDTWLINVLREGQKRGEFSFSGKPEDLAALWIAALPGALQSAQARGEDHFYQVLDQLRKTLNR